ncbi:hypothetical protein OK074_6405 [Actinobacteria bacterium OK074]|nr:hypothetical protein OK074_6405 [Actinobacteria bacterium OK074]
MTQPQFQSQSPSRPQLQAPHLPLPLSRELASARMHALVDRGRPVDVVGVYAACAHHSVPDLEQLAEQEGEFDFHVLRERLEGVVWVDDEEFAAQGLDAADTAALRHWALDWESDLGLRLAEDYERYEHGERHEGYERYEEESGP